MYMNTNEQIHKNHRNRMKNTFVENGFKAFSEIQKLEFLLFFAIPQKDVNPLAHSLLSEFGSLNKVISASFEDLLKVPGVGKHTALLLKTFKAVSIEQPVASELTKLSSTALAKEYCYNLLKYADVEEFYVICLDDCNKTLKTKKLNEGTANRVHVEISEVTKLIFSHKATKLIVSHNHPSGSTKYSDDDIRITNSIMCSCLLNGVELIDHVLVCPTDAVSFADLGIISTLKDVCLKHLNIPVKPATDPASPFEEYITEEKKE